MKNLKVLLKEYNIRPKRSLGQNFLFNKNILEKIAKKVLENIKNIDYIVEVGPGIGNLTELILKNKASRKKQLILVEKDKALVKLLKEKFENQENIKIIEGDILEMLSKLKLKKFKLIGNIPYSLAKPLINKALSLEYSPKEILFLIQKEVAEDLVNPQKTSILNLSVNLRAKVEKLFIVKKESFFPKPKVDGVFIRIYNIKKIKNFDKLMKIIKMGLQFKRKTLYNNLKTYFDKKILNDIFRSVKLKKSIRGEDLSKNQWLKLSKKLDAKIQSK